MVTKVALRFLQTVNESMASPYITSQSLWSKLQSWHFQPIYWHNTFPRSDMRFLRLTWVTSSIRKDTTPLPTLSKGDGGMHNVYRSMNITHKYQLRNHSNHEITIIIHHKKEKSHYSWPLHPGLLLPGRYSEIGLAERSPPASHRLAHQ